MAVSIPEYDELKLQLERGAGNSYTVIAESADGRRVRGFFTRPVTDKELDEFVRGVGLVRRARRTDQERLKDVEDLGSELFTALVRDQVAEVYHAARAAAQERDRGLRITLNLSGAPELTRLPWELLYRRPRFLSQSTRTPVVRSLDLESARRPRKVKLPLRVLGVVSSPTGYPELDAGEERRKLEQALSRLRDEKVVELEWLKRATLEELGRRVADPDEEIHIIHYIGHGAYDEATEGGVLVLETPQGRAHDVSGRMLGSMLQDEESLRLVVLNSCEGARGSLVDPFSGVATSLVEFDIPAVIGMQFEITDEAAIAFSDSLYTSLAHALPVDAALGPARRAIVAAHKEAEFATPVLFLRSGDARLFDVPDRPQAPPKPPPDRPQAPPKPPPDRLHAPPKPPLPRLPRPPTWRFILEGVIVAGLAALVARSLAPDITLDIGTAGEPSRFITNLIQTRGVTWAVAGAALGIWLAFRVRAAHDYARCAVLGLLVGAIAGALGGAIFGFPVAYGEDRNPFTTIAEWINVGSFAVTGALIGALIGGLWLPPRVAAGLASGGVAAALAVAPFVQHITKEGVFCLNAAAIAGATLATLVAIDAKRPATGRGSDVSGATRNAAGSERRSGQDRGGD
jgi:CHAT domain